MYGLKNRGGGGSNFEGVQKSRDLSRDQKLVTWLLWIWNFQHFFMPIILYFSFNQMERSYRILGKIYFLKFSTLPTYSI